MHFIVGFCDETYGFPYLVLYILVELKFLVLKGMKKYFANFNAQLTKVVITIYSLFNKIYINSDSISMNYSLC